MAVTADSAKLKQLENYTLTYARGVVAILVVLSHSTDVVYRCFPHADAWALLSQNFRFRVPFFFLLSGYVLGARYFPGTTLPDAARLKAFFKARFVRLYPIYFILLMAYLVFTILGWSKDEGRNVLSFLRALTLTEAWTYDISVSWNFPTWTLSAECFCYLLFPLISVGVNRMGRDARRALMVVLFVAATAIFTLNDLLPFEPLVKAVPMFTLGLLLARAKLFSTESFAYYTPLLVFIGVTAVLAAFLPVHIYFITAYLLMLSFVFVAVYGHFGKNAQNSRRNEVLHYLGISSYSMFITHALAMGLGKKLIPFDALLAHGMAGQVACLVLFYGLIFLVAVSFYHLVEKPTSAWAHRIAKGARSEPLTA